MNLQSLLDIRDLAVLLKCSQRQCWRLVDSGHLPQALRPGGGRIVRWHPETISQWLTDGAPDVRRTGWTPDSVKSYRGARS